MAPPRRPLPALIDELVEEILLRFPPSEPAGLVRAALVCKRWGRLVSSPRFRRRFCDHHRAAAMLGVLCNLKEVNGEYVSRFVPAAPSGPRRPDHRGWRALDARHGRVLLRSLVWGPYLNVWDPVTGERRQLPMAPPHQYGWNAAVLCAAHDTCDHLYCRGGPFLVVILGADDYHWIWTETKHVARLPKYGVHVVPPVLIGNALYFGIDLSRKASEFRQPPGSFGRFTMLTSMEDGRLGMARLLGGRLSIWSMLAGSDVDAVWTQIRVIELERLLPVNALPISCDFIGSVQGFGVLFVGTKDGLYSVDIKCGTTRKVTVVAPRQLDSFGCWIQT
ncbi:hypothetical protein EJB05_14415, partial [Eragrostis curvula]